jgi:hypothetical protein
MARLPASRQVELIGEKLRGPLRAEILAKAAEAVFGAHRTHNRAVLGYDLPEVIKTDGVAGRPVEAMRVGGAELLTGLVSDFLPDVMAILEDLSPRGRSNSKPDDERYAKSHVAIIDGVETPAPYLVPPDWRRIVIASRSPYGRKIERGLSRSRPDGVYEAVAFPRIEDRLKDTPYDVQFEWVGDIVAAFGRKSAIGTVVRSRRNVRRRRRIYDASRARIAAIIITRGRI